MWTVIFQAHAPDGQANTSAHRARPGREEEGSAGAGCFPPWPLSPCAVSCQSSQWVLGVQEMLGAGASADPRPFAAGGNTGSRTLPLNSLLLSHECQEKLGRGRSGPAGRATMGAGVLGYPPVCMGFEGLGVGDRPGWEWGDRTRPALNSQSSPHTLDPAFSECQRVLGSLLAQTQACWMTSDQSQPQYPHL